MRFVRSLFLLFSFVLLFFGAYSDSCYAKDLVTDLRTTFMFYCETPTSSAPILIKQVDNILNSPADNYTTNAGGTITGSTTNRDFNLYQIIKSASGKTIIEKETDVSIRLSGMLFYLTTFEREGESEFWTPRMPIENYLDITLTLYEPDGTAHEFSEEELIDLLSKTVTEGSVDISFELKNIEYDVVSVRIRYDGNVAHLFNTSTTYSKFSIGVGYDGLAYGANIAVTSEETGFLKKILQKIIELPDRIFEGIKNLFVPDSDYIIGYKDRFDSLLSDHFGAVYDSISLIDELADAFMSDVSDKSTIHMPTVTIPLGDTEFSFGGYDVKLVPDRFIPIVDILKMLIGLVCTLLFVMMLKHRYEEVISK